VLRFERYPRVFRYLTGLPNGLGSYATCVQKASVLRQFLKLAPASWRGDLPEPLGALVRDPPPFTAWVPEVQATAVYLAIVDVREWEDKDFVARALTMNRELLKSPLYRVLMTVVSPGWLVRGAPSRWATMHQGIELSAQMVGDTSAQFDLTFPRRLVPTLIAQCYATAFQAALESASARKVSVSLGRSTDETATYRCDWR
jgi:hypothetical protein